MSTHWTFSARDEPASEAVLDRSRWLARFCGLVVMIIGTVAALADVWQFLDTRTDFPKYLQGQLHADDTGMALLTGLAFALCGLALFARPRRGNPISIAATVLVLAWCAYVLLAIALQRAFGVWLPTDADLPSPFGEPPMSGLTAFIFICAGLVLLHLLIAPSRAGYRQAAVGVCVVGLISLVVLLGYARGVELLREILGVPVALLTAATFLILDVGLIAALGPYCFPLRPFLGPSARAVLLRTLLPAILGVLLLEALAQGVLSRGRELNREQMVLFMAATFVLTIMVVATLVGILARQIGGAIDAAEQARVQANEDLLQATRGLKAANRGMREAKEAGEKANRELESTNQQLRQAKEAAEAANKVKQAFLMTVTHELRTPLNTIKASLDLLGLLASNAMDLTPAQREQLHEILTQHRQLAVLPRDRIGKIRDLKERMRDNADYLHRLVDNVLDFGSLEANSVRLNLTSLELGSLLQKTTDLIEPLTRKEGNKFQVDLPPYLGHMVGDFMRLQECLVNLLGNANKFTHSGEITLTVRREWTEGQEWVIFRVTDTGIGMTPEQQARLFQPYHTLQKQGSRSYRGAGLGLVISRELCRLMKGTLELEASAPGQGSTFHMRVPVYGGPLSARMLGPGNGPRPRVLAIDDDPQVLSLLAGLLGQEGFDLLTATNGKQGFLLAEKERPQAITLDVLLPDMDGWAVLAQLKGTPETAHIPVIMLTVLGEVSTGQALGAVATLAKPIDEEQLLGVLRTCRENHEPRLVLVVDDDPAFRSQIRPILEADGWTVAEAGDGREALAHLQRRPPALILLDLVMPGLDGGAFVEELSRHPNWEQIPVVLVTATPLASVGLEAHGKVPLGGCLRRILHKGALTAEQLQKEVRSATQARVEV